MGLYDERRPGDPRSIEDERVSALIKKTIQTKPRGGTHWWRRSIAVETGSSKSTVQRVWHAFGVQPRRQKHFKISTDPFFVEKVTQGRRVQQEAHLVGEEAVTGEPVGGQAEFEVLDPVLDLAAADVEVVALFGLGQQVGDDEAPIVPLGHDLGLITTRRNPSQDCVR